MSGKHCVVVAGGSGFIGRAIRRELLAHGSVAQVIVIGRTRPALLPSASDASEGATGSPQDGAAREVALTWAEIERDGLPDCDAVINVTGNNLAEGTRDEQGMEAMKASRSGPVKTLVTLIKSADGRVKPKVFIFTSGAAIYPTNAETGDKVYDESFEGPFSQRLIGRHTVDLEHAADELPKDIRRVCIRTGNVLGKTGGIFARSKLPLGMGYLAKYGDGSAPWAWIHERDCARMYIHPIFNPTVEGVLNAVANDQSTQAEFGEVLAKVTNQWVWSLPEFLVSRMLGPLSSILLEGPRVLPKKAVEKDKFTFLFGDPQSAIEDLTKQ